MSTFRLAAILSLSAAGSLNAAMYNAVSDFSLASNPTGPWSYLDAPRTDITGYAANTSQLFTTFADCGSSTAVTGCWFDSGLDGVVRNVSGAGAVFNGALLADQTLGFFSRQDAVIVRFTAPSTALYDVFGFFNGDSTIPLETRVLVAINGNVTGALLDLTEIRAFDENDPFSFSGISLNSGDTLDFLSMRTGPTAFDNNAVNGFDVSIESRASEVPEPATWGLISMGALYLGWARRRRHQP